MLTLDHVVASSRRLDDACGAWERLGFTIAPRGFHPFGTMNNLVMFQRTFFELLALRDVAAFEAAVAAATIPASLAALTRTALETRDGPSLLAVTSDDADPDLRAVNARGVRVSAPMHFKRRVVLPDGQETAADVTVHFLEDTGENSVPVFVSQQHNREAVWVSEWQDHRNGAVDIVAVTYTAERPDELVPYLAAVLGEPRRAGGDELWFPAGPSRVIVTTPARCRARFSGVVDDGFPETPSLEALTVSVRDLRRTGERLAKNGVRLAWTSACSLQVGREDAAGALLEFVEADGKERP